MDLRSGSHHGIRWSVAVGLSAALLLLVYLLLPAPSAAAREIEAQAQGTYLALGDSLAFGYSQQLFNEHAGEESPTFFEHGYVNDFAEALRQTRPDLKIVNDGCPGETTGSMIYGSERNGSCEYELLAPLHHPYAGSQLSDALGYLAAHPGEVNPITIDIGANDVLAMLRKCDEEQARNQATLQQCIGNSVGGLFQHIATNLGIILGDLRRAAPHAQIIVLGLYNPFGSSIPGGNLLAAGLNQVMQEVAAGVDARFVDPLPQFNPAFASPEDKELLGREAEDICSLTNMCLDGDIHPTPLGYDVLAGAILQQYIVGLPGRDIGDVSRLESTGLLGILEGYGG